MMGYGSLTLKRWSHLSNPYLDHIQFRYLSVVLLGFSLKMWCLEISVEIGNFLAKFLHMEEDCLLGFDGRSERILVEIDIHVGMLASYLI